MIRNSRCFVASSLINQTLTVGLIFFVLSSPKHKYRVNNVSPTTHRSHCRCPRPHRPGPPRARSRGPCTDPAPTALCIIRMAISNRARHRHSLCVGVPVVERLASTDCSLHQPSIVIGTLRSKGKTCRSIHDMQQLGDQLLVLHDGEQVCM
jgi:hypothetical protein